MIATKIDEIIHALKPRMILLVRDLYQRDKRNEIFEANFWTLFEKSNPEDGFDKLIKRVNIKSLDFTPFMVDIEDRFRLFKVMILEK